MCVQYVLKYVTKFSTPKVKISSMWDVLDSPYRVVVITGTANYMRFSGMLALDQFKEIYEQKMSGRDDAIVKDIQTARAMMLKDPRVLFFSSGFSLSKDPNFVSIHVKIRTKMC